MSGSLGVPPFCREMGAKVLRGGSWNNNMRNVRSSNRNRNRPDNRNNNVGFRCANSLSDPSKMLYPVSPGEASVGHYSGLVTGC